MDRVNGADWFDIGGGKRGFRAQNAGLGIPGTEVTDTFLNDVQEELLFLAETAGLVPAAGDRKQVAGGIRSGKLSYIVAGGTANAITVALDPTLVTYTAGLVLRIKISAANTGPVTINVDGRGVRNIYSTDGLTLSAGDLLVGDMATVIFDGAAFRLTSVARSEVNRLIKAQKVTFFRLSQANTSIPHNVATLVTDYAGNQSQLDDTTYLNGVITIGTRDAGKWLVWGSASVFSFTRIQTAIMVNGNPTSTGDDADAVNQTITTGNLNALDFPAGTTVQLRLLQTNTGGLAQVVGGFLLGMRVGT